MSSNFFDQFDTDSPPQNFFDQFDTEAPGSQKETGPFLASGAPETAPRPVARPRVSGFAAALEEDPSSPVPEERPFVSRRNPRDIRGPGTAEEQTYQGPADLGRRFARGASEIAAGLPEAAAIAGFGNRNASALFAAEEVQRAREQIQAAEQRLAEYPDMSDADRRNIESIIDAERRKVSAYEPLIETADGPLKPEAQDRGLYKRGDQLRAASEELFGSPDEEFDDRFVSKLAEGAGSMAGFVAATLATGVVGGAGVGAATNSAQMYREARDEGATEEQAKTAAFLGSMVGASEVVPIGRALDLLPSELRGRVANAIGKRLSNAFLTAGEEGAQEALTQISNNLIAQGVWDSQRGTLDGAGEAALIGAVLGGGLGAVAGGGRDTDRLDSPRLTDADRASPLPNDVIDDGKAIIDDLLNTSAPGPLRAPERTDKAPEAPSQAAEPEVSSAAPNQPEDIEAEILPVIGADGQETGSFVRVNPINGRIEKVEAEAPIVAPSAALPEPEVSPAPSIEDAPTGAEIPAVPVAEAAQLPEEGKRVAPGAPVAPSAPQAVEAQAPRKPGKVTLQKRPVAQELKTRGLSVKPGSPLAEELKARGITPRTHPGLFNANGRTDWDNLPAAEWQDYRHELGEDGNGYLSQQGLIDALETEMRGAPVQVGEQADLQAAADAKEAEARFAAAEPDPEEIDLSHIPEAQAFITRPEEDISTPNERMDFVVRNVDTVLAETGIAPAVPPQMRQEIITVLNDRGGNVEDAIWWNLHKKADGYAEQTAQPRVADQSPDGQAARGGGPASEVSGDLGRSEADAGEEGGSPAVDQDDRRADVGQAEEPAAPAVSDPVPSVSVRAVEPAPLPSIPKDLPKPKALPETRGQGQRFHGSPAPIEQLEEGFYTSQNYYGQGFYTSDAIDIVDGYARRNKQDGNVYQISESGEVKAFDMEQPVPDFVVKAYRDLPDSSTVKEIIEIGLIDDAGSVDAGSVREMYDRMREEADYSADTIQEAFEVLRETFVENGFNALDHTGGLRTKKKPHQVRIYLEPEKQIRFTEIDRNGPINPTTERTEAGEQAVIPGAEQSAERSAEARKADQRREMEARQQQSKKRTTVQQGDAGPLFDTQGDMFDQPRADAGPAPAAKPKPSKTQERLTGILRDAWTAREDLPDDATDEFLEATKRVQDARRALSEEFGEEAANSALEKIEAEYKPKAPEPVQERTDQERVKKERIEDFGEKIGGAQKDKAKGWLNRASEVSDDEIASVPLSKSWPEPDYEALIEEGTDPSAVAFIHAARDEIPNKPRQGFKLERWARQVRLLREFAISLIDGTVTIEDVRNRAAGKLDGFMGRVALYERYGHEKSLKGVSLRQGSYSVYKGERFSPAKKIWVAEVKRRMLAEGETQAEAVEAFAPVWDDLGGTKDRGTGIKFEIRKWRTGNIFIGKKVGRDWFELASDPDWDWAAARKYLAENQQKLEEEYARKKALPPERGESNSPRTGTDHRSGQDVTPEMFSEAFGFRGVQFGNYVEGARRQQDLNEAFDGLMDLAGVIGVPPKALSLNGELGLAFGARGSGRKAAAHYEPGEVVINLTKGQGAGSLAHEWWHAMDHYFARQGGKSALLLTEVRSGSLSEGIRREMVEAFDKLTTLIRKGELKVRSSVADKRKSKPYFATMPEMTARAFESYVIGKLNDQSASNDYLANILSEDAWNAIEALAGQSKPSWPYVRASEMPEFREAFDNLFDTIKIEETDKGVRMYQRQEPVAVLDGTEVSGSDIRGLRKSAQAWFKENLLNTTATTKDGWEVRFNNTGLRKSTSKGDEILRYVPAIRSIVEQGEVIETRAGNRAGIDAVHVISAPVELAGETRHVVVSIRQMSDGRFQYDLTLNRDQEGKARPSQTEGGTMHASPAPVSNQPSLEINLGLLAEKINRRSDPAKLQALLPDLKARLDKLMIRGVDLTIDPDMREQGAAEFGPEGIEILIGNTLDGMNTLNHEAIHVLRSRGLFSDREWQTLTREAEATWLAKYDIEERYPDLGREAQIEEAIAEAFAEFADGRAGDAGTLQKIISKVKRFFRALKEALAGQGIRKPEDIFTDVDRGAIGARDEGRVTPQELLAAQSQSEAGRKRQAARRKTSVPPVQSLFGASVPLSIPDRRIWDEFSKSGNGFWGSIKGAAGAMHDKIDRARVQVQDRFLPVLRAQEAIERATGQAIPEQMNAYLAEETFSGKVGRHLFEIDEEFTKPIIDLIAETNGDMTVDTVGKWLTARHAKERNAYIASINDKMPDGGSGMTNAEADAVLRDVASGKHAASYQKIGKMLDDLRERTMDLRVDAGLMTKRDAMLWRSQYKHYVPLKGFAETDNYDAYLNLQGVNARYTVKGQESQRALGRSSEAFNPLQAAITQAQEVAVRAEKNRVGRSLFDLASHNPSEALWEVKDVLTKRYYNQTTGRVEEMAVDPASMRLEPNELAVKINGKEKRIIFHDPRLAAAAGTVGADQMGSIIRILSMASRYFSAVNTMLDPEFVIRNAFRDLTTAQINIRNFGKDDRNRIAKAMVKNWRKAFVAVYRGQANKADTEWTRYYREFEQAGGKVSFWKLDQPEAGKGDLERRVNLATGNKFIRVGKVLTSPKAFFSERDNSALAAVERVNLSVDNAIRLAAFVEARKAGWSKAEAASLSKNLTVNFNRRGLKGPGLNAAYPFFNAAMQGSQILVRAMTSKRMAKYMVALVGYGVFEDMINAAISEEDDDGELAYDKIPDWKLEMNLVWMRSEGNATTVPLPYGYNVFPYLGKQIGKVMRGVKDPGEAFGDVASATFGAFSPIAMDQSENTGLNMVKLLSPMATDSLIEMASNRDWLDRPIRPENPYGDYGPDAYKFYGGASEGAKTIADVLNRISGGNRSEAGAIDISPEYIDHMTAFLTGGAGRFAGRATDMTTKLLSGDLDLIEGHKVPFVRSMNTTTGTWLDKDRYYRFRDEVREAVAAVKTEDETGDPVFFETKVKASLSGEVTIADRRLKKIRKERDAAGDNASPAQRADWDRREADAVLSFNRKYIEKLGQQAE